MLSKYKYKSKTSRRIEIKMSMEKKFFCMAGFVDYLLFYLFVFSILYNKFYTINVLLL